jgi:NADP-dependent 3-hydroxy acid dehydrogenase YdfG
MLKHESPVWLITGCSTGLGEALAKLVIDQGWRAVVTARDRARVGGIVKGAEDRAIALDLDVTNYAQIDEVIAATQAKFGRIDVLVNNAGHGYQRSIEEGVESEIRA